MRSQDIYNFAAQSKASCMATETRIQAESSENEDINKTLNAMTKQIKIVNKADEKTKKMYIQQTSPTNHQCAKQGCCSKTKLSCVVVIKGTEPKNRYITLICDKHIHEKASFYASTELIKH